MSDKTINKKFKSRINQLKAGVSNRAFGAKCDISEASVRKAREGQVPGETVLDKIAISCGVSKEWLLGLSDVGGPKTMTITGDQNIQSGRDTSGGSVHVPGRGPEDLHLTTEECFLINTLRKLPNYEDMLADFTFQAMQELRESKNSKK